VFQYVLRIQGHAGNLKIPTFFGLNSNPASKHFYFRYTS